MNVGVGDGNREISVLLWLVNEMNEHGYAGGSNDSLSEGLLKRSSHHTLNAAERPSVSMSGPTYDPYTRNRSMQQRTITEYVGNYWCASSTYLIAKYIHSIALYCIRRSPDIDAKGSA